MWILWSRAAIEDQICIFRTTMLMESHWKVIKRDFLPKFFRPRIDLLIYIIISRLIPHHQQQYQKYLNEREHISWKKDFKREWKKLENVKINNFYLTDTTRWICSCLSFARNRFFICKHLVQQYGRPESFYDVHRQERYPFIFFNTMETTSESDIVLIENDNIQKGILQDVTNIEDDDKNETDKIFDEYEEWLNGTLEIIRKQRTFGNYRWAKAIRNSLEGVHKLYSDVKTYQNRHTNPRTF
ncbi:hypothetical protein GLOIN_2v1675679 [Rhizophagus irregularis DAOM 181602=DAOM 197198]|uniref:SWIM-type domain-containing protein n=1 Tax=Rhizophagus irregularis (strain DAOM 181602 / DAOM 197198 / MUCL 43194) TaxID=747089 RepID=A0A2P4PGG5_RHIID|nr:hypothetical protein GLOIN_2v1675679 [Rhizophagus irregularis DAOM 181602=DAOM 197198]POG64489.1 hypothetical protein GLOIN_2v1675679 [Rhizophagus irregularis DAOM 181602=DAOM 197198]|eukprot:XP_025171355.1 hypothetical protein GLOIN_2v1675679 [Rhizophagus irregularis DAOM 181602=DAOM 197198]